MFSAERVTWEICVIGLSLTAFTLVNTATKSYKHKTDLLLCLWLAMLNIPLLHTVLTHLNINASTLHLYTNPTLNLLHGPILYLYVRMLISDRKALPQASELLHLIPFGLFYLLFMSMTHDGPMMPGPAQPGSTMNTDGNNPVVEFFRPLMANFGVINGLIFIAYSVLTILTLKRHQENIKEIFSQKDNQISLKWLYALPATFAALVIFNFVNENFLESAYVVRPHTFHMLSFFCFIVLLCFFGVKQKPVFHSTQYLAGVVSSAEGESQLDSTNTADETNRIRNSDLNEEFITSTIDKMHAYMCQEKPYLDPEFSVYALATAVGLPRRALSQVLSKGLSTNFYQYVNNFRVLEVKSLLEQEKPQQSTILDIAFQSGFKSKSSFNSLFKQHCGMTPSQYRRMVNSEVPSEFPAKTEN